MFALQAKMIGDNVQMAMGTDIIITAPSYDQPLDVRHRPPRFPRLLLPPLLPLARRGSGWLVRRQRQWSVCSRLLETLLFRVVLLAAHTRVQSP